MLIIFRIGQRVSSFIFKKQTKLHKVCSVNEDLSSSASSKCVKIAFKPLEKKFSADDDEKKKTTSIFFLFF